MAGGVYPLVKRRFISREHAIRTKSVRANVTKPTTPNTKINEGENKSFIFKSHRSKSLRPFTVELSKILKQMSADE